jgi:hypothetical protein
MQSVKILPAHLNSTVKSIYNDENLQNYQFESFSTTSLE